MFWIRYCMTTLLVSLLSLPLSGCWDIKDLQEINYVTALGFDIEDEEIVIYGQFLDFASVVKTESGSKGTIPVWIGKGKGKTLIDAIDELYRTSQLRIFFGHVNAIVFGEKLLRDRSAMNQVEQFQGRFHELRFTPWVFSTKDPIEKILSTTSVFEFSPRVSILNQPLETYRQRSVFRPMSMRRFALEMNEPSNTTLLPTIALTNTNWSKALRPQEMLEINGAYAMRDEKVLGWLPIENMLGLSWVEPSSYRGPLILSSGGEVEAALILEQPKITIHPSVRGGKPKFKMKVALTGSIVMLLQPKSESELEEEAAREVELQIQELYDEGLKHEADLLNLETALYRKMNREWKMLRDRGALKLTPESLTDIEVSVKIKRTGNMKKQGGLD